MNTYTKDELIPSTRISRNFGEVLKLLSDKKLSKVAVLKNNKIEAVILPLDYYEKITRDSDLIEHLRLAGMIKDREENPKHITFNEVLSDLGISEDEL